MAPLPQGQGHSWFSALDPDGQMGQQCLGELSSPPHSSCGCNLVTSNWPVPCSAGERRASPDLLSGIPRKPALTLLAQPGSCNRVLPKAAAGGCPANALCQVPAHTRIPRAVRPVRPVWVPGEQQGGEKAACLPQLISPSAASAPASRCQVTGCSSYQPGTFH